MVLSPPGRRRKRQEADRNPASQVVKSLDTNLNLGDHKWEHQTHVAEAPMQEWPMSTAGMKGARRCSLLASHDVDMNLQNFGHSSMQTPHQGVFATEKFTVTS